MADRAEALVEKREKEKKKENTKEKDTHKGKAKVLTINLAELDLTAKVELPLMEEPKPKPPPPSIIKPVPKDSLLKEPVANFANKIPVKEQKVTVPTITESKSAAPNKKAVSESENDSLGSEQNDLVDDLEGSDDAPFEIPSTTRKNSQTTPLQVKNKPKEPFIPTVAKSESIFGFKEEKPAERTGIFAKKTGKSEPPQEKTEGVAPEKKPAPLGAFGAFGAFGATGAISGSTGKESSLFSGVAKKQEKSSEVKTGDGKTAEKKEDSGSIFAGKLFSNAKAGESATSILANLPAKNESATTTAPKRELIEFGNLLDKPKQSEKKEDSKAIGSKDTTSV